MSETTMSEKELLACRGSLQKWIAIRASTLSLTHALKRCDLCVLYDEPTNHNRICGDNGEKLEHKCSTCILARMGHSCMEPGDHDEIHKIMLENSSFYEFVRLKDLDLEVLDRMRTLVDVMIGHLQRAEKQLEMEGASCKE